MVCYIAVSIWYERDFFVVRAVSRRRMEASRPSKTIIRFFNIQATTDFAGHYLGDERD